MAVTEAPGRPDSPDVESHPRTTESRAARTELLVGCSERECNEKQLLVDIQPLSDHPVVDIRS